MDHDRDVLDHLDRIERLDGAGAPPAELLTEVRLLLRAAEQLARRAADDDLDDALARCQAAVTRGAGTSPSDQRRARLDRVA